MRLDLSVLSAGQYSLSVEVFQTKHGDRGVKRAYVYAEGETVKDTHMVGFQEFSRTEPDGGWHLRHEMGMTEKQRIKREQSERPRVEVRPFGRSETAAEPQKDGA